MLPTLEAIKAHLAPLGYSTHLLSAEGAGDAAIPPVPYLVLALAPGMGMNPDELPVCGPTGDIQFGLRVTAVGYPADSPPKILTRVRDVLAPGLGLSRVPAQDRFVTVVYERTDTASQVDRDIFITGANRHPSWGMDSYTVHVQPLSTP